MVIRSQTITNLPKRTRFNVKNDSTLKDIIDCVVEVADPEKIILFGSRSVGNQREGSDYDILVLKQGIRNKRKLAKKIYIALDVAAPVDIIVEGSKDFDKYKKKPYFVYYEIAKTGRVIYSKGQGA